MSEEKPKDIVVGLVFWAVVIGIVVAGFKSCDNKEEAPAAVEQAAPAAEPAPAAPVAPEAPYRAPAAEPAPASGPGSIYTDPATGMQFVYVKGGCYRMGDTFGDGYSDEKVHEVCVDSFWMGKYEVTQGEWERLMSPNPSRFPRGSRYPVENVSWYDAQDFISALSRRSGKQYRLPTEAEWEYAAREGGRKVRFGTGKDTIGPDEANFDARSDYKESYSRSGRYRESTVEVGSFAPNGLGLYDMSGNVWEWCSDWYSEEYYGLRDNPGGPSSGSYRVNRGGSWDFNPRRVRAAFRLNHAPDFRVDDLGFRLVVPPDQRVR